MVYIEIIGFTAGIFTTLALVPQAIKSWKSKHTKDVSLMWITILTVGIFLWLVYGVLINSMPLITANIVSFLLAVIILILKIKYQ